MKRRKFWLIFGCWCVLHSGVSTALAQGTAFTYQGRLNASNGPANGNYDFVFTSFGSSGGNDNNGGPVTNSAKPVINGLFTVTLDFGAGAFTNGTNWLQIAVRTNDPTGTNASAFVVLTPRQLLTPTPYAIEAAGIVGGGGTLTGLNASQLTNGTVPNARLPADVALLDSNQTYYGTLDFTGNIGLGTATPAFPLSLPSLYGDKIGLSAGPGSHFGFGTQPGLLQIYASGPGDAIAFGYGSSAAMTETMRIMGNGNVGIGTAMPGAPLDVRGALQVNANGTVESIGTAGAAGSYNGMIESYHSAGDRYGLAQLSNGITALYTSSAYASSSLQFGQMTGGAAFSPQVTVDHGGNLSTVGNVTASGNITASGKFAGDGSGLFNLNAALPPPNPRKVALLKWGVSSLDNSFTVGSAPRAVCFDGSSIWVANSGSGNVTKLDASTGASGGNYSAGSGPDGICFDGANIWVANSSGTVTKINATTGSLIANYSAGSSPAAICFDGASIWVANYGGANVTKLNAGTGAAIGTYGAGSNPSGICFDGSSIWVVNSNSASVTKLDASSGNNLGTFGVGSRPQGICFDGTHLWVANNGGGSVTELDPATGNTVGTYTVGTTPAAVCFDGANIWVANNGSGNVMKLDNRTGAVLGTYSAGSSPNAICFDTACIWVVNPGGTVKKL